jgi:sterol desaturase/sphingolipid hydroxylase (fatty acid hydroxylase superfamily)
MPWSIVIVGVFFLAFGVMARFMPCNPGQPRFFTPEMIDDALYWALGIVLYGDITLILIKLAAGGDPVTLRAVTAGYGWAARMPVWGQVLAIFMITDIIQYWIHRLLHGRTLWPFHAIHHSPREVTWSTTYRVHPVNWLIYMASVAVLTRLMGFSPAAFAAMAPINLLIGAVVHANLNWTFGPLKYVIASPVFHRWHHSSDPAVRDKNFAPTFPILDVIFGTFHMPAGELPQGYGADGVPGNFFGQMAYPFLVVAARFGRKAAQAA